MPGHHFQFARGLELPDAPMFRRTAYFVAYGEGWGAVRRAAWATTWACTTTRTTAWASWPTTCGGPCAWWWTPACTARAGAASRPSTTSRTTRAKTEQDIVNEIDRYIGTPGQALAYKIGQLKISELRGEAERELGDGFDLRAFNDAVLATGSVPLEALETHIDAWIAARSKSRQNSACRLAAKSLS